MLTERALESFKQFVETNIAYAMVEYGGTMHKAKILTRERLKDGRVALSISITPEVSGTTTITKIQLYDTASKLNADGTITHEAVEGEVVQEGTPQNAQNFNDLEERVLSAGLIANLAMLKLGAAESRIKGLQGEIVEATLTNTKSYPFNNSKKTLALTTPRGNLDYTVNVEAEAKDAGGVGEIRITDKQLNGFKIEYTGAAKEVTVKCTVQGGYA